jgi:hypothetical protein
MEEAMTDHKQLRHDIDTLRASIRLEWQEVEAKDLGRAERLELMHHISWCVNELSLLLRKFEDAEKLDHPHA